MIHRRIIDIADDAIISLDAAYLITLFNQGAERIFGYQASEMIGQPLDRLLPKRFLEVHSAHLDSFAKLGDTARMMGERRPIYGKRKDGTEFPAEASISKFTQDGQPVFTAILRDISERKRMENELKQTHDDLEKRVELRTSELAQALAEKEILLREIHHRVKNNLQIIASLLNLQCSSADDEQVVSTFRECRHRVESMALIHEQLHQSRELSGIHLSSYISTLVNDLVTSYVSNRSLIDLNMQLDDLLMDIDTAVPCGLIINELVSNTLKHAFPSGRAGRINIVFTTTGDDKLQLIVEDNGVGLPLGLDWQTTSSLGLRLVHILAAQLKGDVQIDGKNGTRVCINFTPAEYLKRI